jgi:hypothetical protein
MLAFMVAAVLGLSGPHEIKVTRISSSTEFVALRGSQRLNLSMYGVEGSACFDRQAERALKELIEGEYVRVRCPRLRKGTYQCVVRVDLPPTDRRSSPLRRMSLNEWMVEQGYLRATVAEYQDEESRARRNRRGRWSRCF